MSVEMGIPQESWEKSKELGMWRQEGSTIEYEGHVAVWYYIGSSRTKPGYKRYFVIEIDGKLIPLKNPKAIKKLRDKLRAKGLSLTEPQLKEK